MIKNTNKHLQLLPKLSHHLQLKTQKTIQTSLNQFFEKRNDPHESVKSVENLQENVESMPSSPLLFDQTLPRTPTDRYITYCTVYCIFM